MWQPQEHAQADHRKLEIFAPKYSIGLLRHPTDDSSRGGAAGGEPKDLMFDRRVQFPQKAGAAVLIPAARQS